MTDLKIVLGTNFVGPKSQNADILCPEFDFYLP